MLHTVPHSIVRPTHGPRLERCGIVPSRPAFSTHRRVTSLHATGPDGFSEFQKKASKWVADNKLDEKAAAAAKTAKSKFGEACESASAYARTTYTKLDSEYRFGEKFATVGKRVDEAWKDVDQEFGVRRKLRSASEEFQRRWPGWKKQLDAFFETSVGQAVGLFLFVFILTTPLFWSIVSSLFLLWWLSIPISLILLGLLGEEATRLMEEQQTAEEELQNGVNPFEDIFNTRATGGTGGFRSRDSDGGPVIDADYTVLDDDRKK